MKVFAFNQVTNVNKSIAVSVIWLGLANEV